MRCIRLAIGDMDSVGIDVDTGNYVYLKFVGPFGHEDAYSITERLFQNFVLNQTNIRKSEFEKFHVASTQQNDGLDKLKIIKSPQIKKLRKLKYIISAEVIDDRSIKIYTIDRTVYKMDYKSDILSSL